MGAENSKPILHLAPHLELSPRAGPVPLETRLAFSYLGRLHLREELSVLLNRPSFAENWDNKRIIALAEVMQLAGENLQPIYDHIAFREQKAIADNRNQYVRDRIAILQLKTQTIDGNPAGVKEVLEQVVRSEEVLDPLLYIAEWHTERGRQGIHSYIDTTLNILSELGRTTNKGYAVHPSEVSRGFKRVGTLAHRIGTDPKAIFDIAEDWLTSFPKKQESFWECKRIASGMIDCNLTERATALASKLQKSRDIKVRHTANEIYEEAAMKLASEGKFDQAIEVQKMTKGSRNSLLITIYGDRAIYEATQSNNPLPTRISHLSNS